MSPLNLCTPYYDDGEDVTGHTTAAVTGKRFLKVSAARQPGGPAGVSDDIGGGNIKVAQCVAGDKAYGVAEYDAAINSKVGVVRGNKVVPITAGAAISAGDLIMSDAAGKAVPYAPPALSGNAENLPVAPQINGYAVTDAAINTDAQISLNV